MNRFAKFALMVALLLTAFAMLGTADAQAGCYGSSYFSTYYPTTYASPYLIAPTCYSNPYFYGSFYTPNYFGGCGLYGW